ncbi:prolyl aminopeptidase [Emcibacter sp. SYSU 3D8]|uniref:prolyl aminopeptidase n=1 Tax=Emcibacter sp. SYSU 3D8 TaxID=3133969 RepID=UPI0031FF3D52
MTALYPDIEPHARGMLDVGDGQSIYWESCGNPSGRPAVMLHGGPGSGCTPGMRRIFDPHAYRIILFDQRGSGRSRPHASASEADLSVNTTDHLIADMETLRNHLGVARWLVWGGSWGSTLALAYAQTHPARVRALILCSVTTTTQTEIDRITQGVGRFIPDAWRRFQEGIPPQERTGHVIADYHRLLVDQDPATCDKAARDWCDWEQAVLAAATDLEPHPRYDSPVFRLGFARLVTHYWLHAAWLEDGVLLRGASTLANIPGIMIHGLMDIGSPLITARRLAGKWPGSELVVIGGAGHDTRSPGMNEAMVAATDRLATLLS